MYVLSPMSYFLSHRKFLICWMFSNTPTWSKCSLYRTYCINGSAWYLVYIISRSQHKCNGGIYSELLRGVTDGRFPSLLLRSLSDTGLLWYPTVRHLLVSGQQTHRLLQLSPMSYMWLLFLRQRFSSFFTGGNFLENYIFDSSLAHARLYSLDCLGKLSYGHRPKTDGGRRLPGALLLRGWATARAISSVFAFLF